MDCTCTTGGDRFSWPLVTAAVEAVHRQEITWIIVLYPRILEYKSNSRWHVSAPRRTQSVLVQSARRPSRKDWVTLRQLVTARQYTTVVGATCPARAIWLNMSKGQNAQRHDGMTFNRGVIRLTRYQNIRQNVSSCEVADTCGGVN